MNLDSAQLSKQPRRCLCRYIFTLPQPRKPGHAKPSHHTQTVNYDVVLSGEIDLELEGEQSVHFKAGDVVIVRGGTHTWLNKGTVPAVTAFILVDALPFRVDGKLIEPLYPADPGSTFEEEKRPWGSAIQFAWNGKGRLATPSGANRNNSGLGTREESLVQRWQFKKRWSVRIQNQASLRAPKKLRAQF